MKVVVGLSGGVDSAVSAYLLQQQGYHVIGVFMQNWHDDRSGGCLAEYDLHDAQTIADQLNIDFKVVDFSHAYKTQVFDHFLDQLSQGLTPNPDVFCNRYIKFERLRHYAKSLGASQLATGHYAQKKEEGGVHTLWQGADAGKDQTYFLGMLRQDQLADSLFPLGAIQKSQVREIASSQRLVTATKKDSTGICFIGERRFSDFIQHYLLDKPGDIISVDGERLGQHRGLIYYTLGQRKGLAIGGQSHASELPWYVVDKQQSSNRLIVAQGEHHPALYRDHLRVQSLSWVSGQPEDFQGLSVKIRYRQAAQPCRIESFDQGCCKFFFDSPQRAITPGQIAVIYRGNQCLGAGVICS